MMIRRDALLVLTLGLATSEPVYPQAIPFCLDPLLANQQVRSLGVAAGQDLALVLKPFPDALGNAVIYKKVGGSWMLEFSLLASGNLPEVNKTVPNEVALGTGQEINTYDKSAGFWNFGSSVSLSGGGSELIGDFALEGDILAVLVRPGVTSLASGGYTQGSVRIYERSGLGGPWSQVSTINLIPSGSTVSAIESMDLDGTRIVIGSSDLNLVRIYERNFGGPGNWGNIATIVGDVRGHTSIGSSVALDGDRLAATEGAGGPRSLRIETFSRNQGGSDNWGDTGTLLDTSTDNSVYGYQLDADGGRIAVLGLPGAPPSPFSATRSFNPFSGNSRLWVFGPGPGTPGYSVEQDLAVGSYNAGLFGGKFISLCGADLLLGVTPLGYLGSAQWAVSAHMQNTGGSNKWGLAQFLEGPGDAEELGAALDMSFLTLLAGLPGDDGLGTDTGAAMLWTNAGLIGLELWIPSGRIENPDPNNGARFGSAVAILENGTFGEIVAIGAPGSLSERGGVWIFESGYFLQTAPAQIVPPVFPDPGDQFGASLSGFGDFLVVGAPGDDDAGVDAGAFYIFERDLGGTDNWGLRFKILRPAGSSGTGFGTSVALSPSVVPGGSGDAFIVASTPGAPGFLGKVFLFEKDAGGTDNWGITGGFSPPAGGPQGFGAVMDAGPGTVLIGAPGSTGDPGEAYFYQFVVPTGWSLFQTVGGTGSDDPSFGSSVAIAESLSFPQPSANIAVGAPDQGVGGSFSTYGYRGIGTTNWGLLAKKDGASGDQLGAAVGGSIIYFAGGAPGANGTGIGTGKVEAFRAGCYEIWAHNQGPAFTSHWLPYQDADKDRGFNLLEFTLNTDPLSPSSVPNLVIEQGPYSGGGGPVPALYWDEPTRTYCTDFLEFEFDQSASLQSWSGVTPSTDPAFPVRRYFPIAASQNHFRLEPNYPALPPPPSGRPIVELLAE